MNNRQNWTLDLNLGAANIWVTPPLYVAPPILVTPPICVAPPQISRQTLAITWEPCDVLDGFSIVHLKLNSFKLWQRIGRY